MIGINIDDPIMSEFVANLDKVNALADTSDGFVWRLKDESDNAASYNPFDDEQVIINISVWKNIESLEKFTYKTFHSDFLRRRKEWFHKYGEAHHAMWWIKEGEYPRIEQAIARLKFHQMKGPSTKAFDFKTRFPNPE